MLLSWLTNMETRVRSHSGPSEKLCSMPLRIAHLSYESRQYSIIWTRRVLGFVNSLHFQFCVRIRMAEWLLVAPSRGREPRQKARDTGAAERMRCQFSSAGGCAQGWTKKWSKKVWDKAEEESDKTTMRSWALLSSGRLRQEATTNKTTWEVIRKKGEFISRTVLGFI